MQSQKNRIVSLVLAICMVIAIAPSAFATTDRYVDSGMRDNDSSGTQDIDSGFAIKITDMSGAVRDDLKVPDGFKLTVTNADGSDIDPTAYQVDWVYDEDGDEEVYQANSPTLEFPASTIFMMNFPYQPRITERAEEGLSTKLDPPSNFLAKPDSSYLIVEGVAVRPGETHEGVSLSADSKTVTLENLDIRYTGDDVWATPPVLMDLLEEKVTIQVNGENGITSKLTGAMHIVRNHDQEMEKTETLMVGTELLLSSDEFNALWIGVGQKSPTADSNLTVRGMTLSLTAQKGVERQSAGSALCIDKGDLRIEDNGKVNAYSDYLNTIEISSQNDDTHQSALEIVNSTLTIVNNSTLRQAADKPNQTILSALYMGGNKAMLLDNSQLYIQLRTRTAEQVLGYSAFNAEEPTKIINGSTVSVKLTNPEEVDDNTNLLLVGMASAGFDVQNSKVNIELEGSTGDETTVWGFAYGKMPFNVKESDVTVNVKGPVASGIKYEYDHEGGDTSSDQREGPFLGDAGTVNITDANVNINTVSVNTKPTQNRHFALSGRFLNTSFSDTKYGLRVNVTSTLNDNFALGFTKYVRPEKVDYTPGYQAERINLGANSKILSPAQGEINMFSYAENDISNYFQNEVIFGADKTTPATSVTIGSNTKPPSPSGGGDPAPAPVGNIITNPVGTKTAPPAFAEAVKAALAAGGGNATARVTFQNFDVLAPDGVKAILDAAQKATQGTNVKLSVLTNFDKMWGNTVASRITLDPAKLSALMGQSNVPLQVWFNQTGDEAVRTLNSTLAKSYQNKFVSVVYAQQKPYNLDAEFCARLGLENTFGKDATLYFYTYNSATNQLTRVWNPTYWVDEGGFAHITAPFGGSIVITDEPLAKK